VDDFAVLFGEALVVVDVPTEGGHEGVDEIDADEGFVVVG
jgi:hypothetical protein